jgi:ribosomal protein S4
MKLRKRKLIFNNVRFKHKYKLIFQLKANILQNPKIDHFHYKKWKFLKRMKYRRMRLRIYIQYHVESRLYRVSRRYPIRSPYFSYSFRKRLQVKRCFRLWYRIKRIKAIGPQFFKSYKIRENNIYSAVYNIVGLIAKFEQRLDVLIFRLFFFSSLYYVQKIIPDKLFKLNNQLITSYNTYVAATDILTLVKSHEEFIGAIKTACIYRYKPKFVMFLQYSHHIEMNYNILTFYFYQPFTRLIHFAGYFPFYFNYKILNTYFFQHH